MNIIEYCGLLFFLMMFSGILHCLLFIINVGTIAGFDEGKSARDSFLVGRIINWHKSKSHKLSKEANKLLPALAFILGIPILIIHILEGIKLCLYILFKGLKDVIQIVFFDYTTQKYDEWKKEMEEFVDNIKVKENG